MILFNYDEEKKAPEPAFDADFENGSLGRVTRLGRDWYHIELRPDSWYRFHFRVRGVKGRQMIFEFHCRDIGEACYAQGRVRWLRGDHTTGGHVTRVVRPLVSYDGETWQKVDRVEKQKEGLGAYRFTHRFTGDEAYISYQQPYTFSHMLKWIESIQAHPWLSVDSIGLTRNGIAEPALTVRRTETAKDLVVLIGREDADETTGSWAVEGLVEELLTDAYAELLDRHVFQIVPMVSIDGVVAGADFSAGYGYGGYRWHEDPAPAEIENVKRAIRGWVEQDGLRLKFAGKVHGAQCFTPSLGVGDLMSANPAVLDVFRAALAPYYPEPFYEAGCEVSIRPKGFFERFLVDEFGCYDLFATHLVGESPAAIRTNGKHFMKAIGAWLSRER